MFDNDFQFDLVKLNTILTMRENEKRTKSKK